MKKKKPIKIDIPDNPKSSRWFIYKVKKRLGDVDIQHVGKLEDTDERVLDHLPYRFGPGEYICIVYPLTPKTTFGRSPQRIFYCISDNPNNESYHVFRIKIPIKSSADSTRRYADYVLKQVRPKALKQHFQLKKAHLAHTEHTPKELKKRGKKRSEESVFGAELVKAGKSIPEAAIIVEKTFRNSMVDDCKNEKLRAKLIKKDQKKIEQALKKLLDREQKSGTS
jgi:hypothetical protein